MKNKKLANPIFIKIQRDPHNEKPLVPQKPPPESEPSLPSEPIRESPRKQPPFKREAPFRIPEIKPKKARVPYDPDLPIDD